MADFLHIWARAKSNFYFIFPPIFQQLDSFFKKIFEVCTFSKKNYGSLRLLFRTMFWYRILSRRCLREPRCLKKAERGSCKTVSSALSQISPLRQMPSLYQISPFSQISHPNICHNPLFPAADAASAGGMNISDATSEISGVPKRWTGHQLSWKHFILIMNIIWIRWHIIIRPGAAGAFLQTPSSLII